MARFSRFANYKFISLAVTVIMLIVLLRSSNYDETIKNPSQSYQSGSESLSKETQKPASTEGSILSTIQESLQPLLLSSTSNKDSCETVHVIVIDAGSSGSRVHIYDFNKCSGNKKPELLKEHFKMLKPGLSSFKTNFVGAAESLDPLLEFAKEVIPTEKQACSPVVVKATAGLRMLGESESKAILDYVTEYINGQWPFRLIDENPVSIMGGDQEGVFAWITTNFLLGNIGNGENLGKTAAIFDLGGGSTQIVFEPLLEDNKLVENEYKYDLSFGAKEQYELYQYSHLGYGLNEGRNKIYNTIIENSIVNGIITKSNLLQGTISKALENPCLAPESTLEDVKVKLEDGTSVLVNFKNSNAKETFLACRAVTEQVLKKDTACTTQPCSFNGIHQPSLVKEFKDTSDLYVFSFFYDKTVPYGMPLNFNLKDLRNFAEIVCGGSNSWESSLSAVTDISEIKKNPELCMELAFQFELLHTGYEIPLDRELKTCQQIEGSEIGWCLGVALEILSDESSFKCAIQKQDDKKSVSAAAIAASVAAAAAVADKESEEVVALT
ncbi:hypothetical protein QEN19_003437 [Hanseniaspora menglaensis]